MRHGILKEIDWKHVGAILANEGDVEQIDFFKSFLKECSSWGTRFQVEQQLACVNMKLNTEERKAFAMLSYNGEDD